MTDSIKHNTKDILAKADAFNALAEAIERMNAALDRLGETKFGSLEFVMAGQLATCSIKVDANDREWTPVEFKLDQEIKDVRG